MSDSQDLKMLVNLKCLVSVEYSFGFKTKLLSSNAVYNKNISCSYEAIQKVYRTLRVHTEALKHKVKFVWGTEQLICNI